MHTFRMYLICAHQWLTVLRLPINYDWAPPPPSLAALSLAALSLQARAVNKGVISMNSLITAKSGLPSQQVMRG